MPSPGWQLRWRARYYAEGNLQSQWIEWEQMLSSQAISPHLCLQSKLAALPTVGEV